MMRPSPRFLMIRMFMRWRCRMLIDSKGIQIRPFQGSDGELAAILEVYRQCEDFLSLGPVSVASMHMVENDLEISKKEDGIFCLIYRSDSQDVLGVFDFVKS